MPGDKVVYTFATMLPHLHPFISRLSAPDKSKASQLLMVNTTVGMLIQLAAFARFLFSRFPARVLDRSRHLLDGRSFGPVPSFYLKTITWSLPVSV